MTKRKRKKKLIISENLLNEAIKYFEQLDDKLTPLDKLKCFEKGMSIIINAITFSTGKSDIGVDDYAPYCIYSMVKAKPKNLATNAQYCALYVKSSGYYAKLCVDLDFISDFIQELVYSKLNGITEEQFGKDEFELDNEK